MKLYVVWMQERSDLILLTTKETLLMERNVIHTITQHHDLSISFLYMIIVLWLSRIVQSAQKMSDRLREEWKKWP
jgi:hypothetical protein